MQPVNKKTSPLKSSPVTSLKGGDISVPGDKSISHRALMLSSLAIGRISISGLLEGEDVLDTANALRAMGVNITENGGVWQVDGVGIGGFAEPENVLYMGNSGTSTRLLIGLLAGCGFNSFLSGDASLCKRPMARVTEPLKHMGAEFVTRCGNRLPLAVLGGRQLIPFEYELPVASAQVKSAILLAGLNCPGETSVIEPEPTRDHTELMLKYLGADVRVDEKGGKRRITVKGYPELTPRDIMVPGDPSSAAFVAVAALITPGSEVTIKNICANPLRTGLFTTLIEMGADIAFQNEREQAGEKVADIRVKSGKLKGITVPAARAPSMIDEYPVLAVAAAFAEGKTVMEGLAELKVKESNRLQAIADGLAACGVKFSMGEDSLTVEGGDVKGGGEVKTHMDHRIAMSFLVMGMAAKEPVTVDDGEMINTSFPGFAALMNNIGGNID